MQLSSYIAQITGRTQEELFSLMSPLVRIERDIEGNISIPFWHKVLDVPKPTDKEIAKALKMPEPEEPPVVSDRQFRLWVLAKLGVDEGVFLDEASKL